MKPFSLYHTLFILQIAILMMLWPACLIANPIELRGQISLKKETVNIEIDYEKSHVVGEYFFKQRKGKNKKQYSFNIYFSVYIPTDVNDKKAISIDYRSRKITSSVAVDISEINNLILDKINKKCPSSCKIVWFKTQDIIESDIPLRSKILPPFRIEYYQNNYTFLNERYFIYTPIYTYNDAWNNTKYYATLEPDDFTINIKPIDSVNIEIVSEHKLHSIEQNGTHVIHPFNKFDDTGHFPRLWYLMVDMNPIIVKISPKI